MHKRLSSRQTRKNHNSKSLRGDSLIEVMFSIGVFGLAAIGAVSVMNRGLYTAQNSLEITMARNEIDAQAEALRFIHAAYTAEHNAHTPAKSGSGGNYSGLWEKIVEKSGNKSLAATTSTLGTFLSDYSSSNVSCSNPNIKAESYIINYRQLREAGSGFNTSNIYKVGSTNLVTTPTYPRLIFQDYDPAAANLDDDPTSLYANLKPSGAQGIWVRTVRDQSSDELSKIQYFDFYIRTCWDRLGGGTPNTISTTIRLYNPDYEP